MACLSTSGRVVCGSRRQQTHKLFYQLFGSRPGYTTGSGTGANMPGLQRTQQMQLQQTIRPFHGLSFNIGKDYRDLLVSSLPGGGGFTRQDWPRRNHDHTNPLGWPRVHWLLRMRKVFAANASAWLWLLPVRFSFSFHFAAKPKRKWKWNWSVAWACQLLADAFVQVAWKKTKGRRQQQPL